MEACQSCGTELEAGAVQCQSCRTPLVPSPAAQVTASWNLLAATGPLMLAESAFEYSVYDQQRTYGRWPKTPEGYKFAGETYSAYAQSLGHGVAFTASGYQDPARLGLPTDPVLKSQTYSSPLSFVGSTRRLIAWASKASQRRALNHYTHPVGQYDAPVAGRTDCWAPQLPPPGAG